MSVIVDTSVWSLALRRNTASKEIKVVNILRDLITALHNPTSNIKKTASHLFQSVHEVSLQENRTPTYI